MPGTGNRSVSADTCSLALAKTASSAGARNTEAMIPARFFMSPAPKPRVVTAALPSLKPLEIEGGCGSNGMVFLLVVMPTESSSLLGRLARETHRPQVNQQ